MANGAKNGKESGLDSYETREKPIARVPAGDTTRKPGTFAKGNAGHPKPMGLVNKITRDLKSGIVQAAENHGSDGKGKGGLVGYLEFVAAKHPKAFVSLLGRLMPLQVSGNAGTFIGKVQIVAIPQGQYLSAEAIRELTPSLETDLASEAA